MSKRNTKVLGEWGPNGTRVIAAESYWREPLRWNRAAKDAGERHRVFCASLADAFEDRPELDAPRARLLSLIYETPNLDWLLLTKRPEMIPRVLSRIVAIRGNNAWMDWCDSPPANVWLGVSVENQMAAEERIPILCATPAVVRFLSVEPLLEPIHLGLDVVTREHLDCPGGVPGCEVLHIGKQLLDWIIVGGESGPHARPCDIGWIQGVVSQCRANGVHCFVKQLGANPRNGAQLMGPLDAEEGYFPRCRHCGHWDFGPTCSGLSLCNGCDTPWQSGLRDKKGGDPEEWPMDLRVREFPKQEQEQRHDRSTL